MKKYRIVKHGLFGSWFAVERKVLGLFWSPERKFIDTFEEAKQEIEIRSTEYVNGKPLARRGEAS
jgi:hypothetical protein